MDIQWTGMPAVLQQPDMHGYSKDRHACCIATVRHAWIMNVQRTYMPNVIKQTYCRCMNSTYNQRTYMPDVFYSQKCMDNGYSNGQTYQ